MAQLIGKNEGVDYVRGMVHQRPSHTMEYPSETNIRGNAKAAGRRSEGERHHHATGGAVEAEIEKKRHGGMMHHERHERHADGASVGEESAMKRGGMRRCHKAMGGMMPGGVHDDVMLSQRQPMASAVSPMKRGGATHKRER